MRVLQRIECFVILGILSGLPPGRAAAQITIPSPGLIATIAGNGTAGFSGDGSTATHAMLNYPSAVTADSSGNIYIPDPSNYRIRKIAAATGIISTVAGNGTNSFSGDGGLATNASMQGANGVAVDGSGNIFIADTYDNRIRKVSASTGIITTIAGNGTSGFSGDGGPATSAELKGPTGIALDSSGNIYIGDTSNNRVRKITVATGIISTVAGSGNGSVFYSGDGGPATSACMYYPHGIALDASGNIYIADGNNQRIRKVTISTGVITTIAGSGVQGYSGDGSAATAAKLNYPLSVAVDSNGNVYVGDGSNQRIRKITPSTGVITTIAGNGTGGFVGDSGPATSAEIYGANGIALDSSANLYIADTGNQRIRMVGALAPAKAVPTLGLTSSVNPLLYGGTSVFTASISGGRTAGGTVTFQINGNTFGTATVSGTTAVYSGSNEAWAAGTYTISAVYSGDANNNGATTTLTQTVNKASPALRLASSTNPSIFGALTLTATISTGPAGTITFLDGSTSIGSATISGTTATLSAPGLTVGSHTIAASWAGNGNYNPITSASITQVVNKATPLIVWPTPTAINSRTALSVTQLNAIANTNGAFAYSPAVGTTFAPGTYTLSTTFSPTDAVDYTVASKTVQLLVNKTADQGRVTLTINGNAAASYSYGAADSSISVVQGLAAGIIAGAPVKLVPVNDQLYIESTATGSSTDTPYTVTETYDSTDFPKPSFTGTPSSGMLTGGASQNTPGVVVYSYGLKAGSSGPLYSANSNFLNLYDSVMGTWSYSYDGLNRLSGATQTPLSGPGQFYCWSYDSFGGRTNQAISNMAFTNSVGAATCTASSSGTLNSVWSNFNTNNQVTTSSQLPGGIAGTASTWPGNGIYDLAGNVINDGSNQYLYDAEGRVCAVQGGALGPMGYQYDADGNRVGKGTIANWSCDLTTNGYTPTNAYVLDNASGQMTELAIGQNKQMAWEHTNVTALGTLIASYDPNGLHFYLNDPLGTRRVQTDPAGVPEQTCQSLPFGDQLSCSNSIATPTEHHFTGKERDAESGLDYFGTRYLSSNMGRWMSPDYSMNSVILELPQSWNKYSYELNRPNYGTDPDGRCPWCVGAIVGGVVEGGFDLGKQWLQKGSLSEVSWKEVGANALGGAVAGAVAVATGGASLVGSAVADNIIGSTVGNVVGGVVTRETDPNTPSADVLSAGEIVQDTVSGFVGGTAGTLAGEVIHVPDEPVRPDPRHQARTSVYNVRNAARNKAAIQQAVRSGVVGSASTHTTNNVPSLFNRFWNWVSPPTQPTVTTDQGDGWVYPQH